MSTTTLTFGDCAENHKGMQQIGERSEKGFSLVDLKKIHSILGGNIHKLNCIQKSDIDDEYNIFKVPKAYILIIKNGVEKITDLESLKKEQSELKPDTKCFMYGRVVNKNARYNLCFSEYSQEPDFENKKGTIIAYKDVPETKKIKDKFDEIMDDNFQCEGNYYYDIKKTYIGFHGDTERKKVIGVRLGSSFPLFYQWYHKNEKIGQ